jgi:hypothetical protein
MTNAVPYQIGPSACNVVKSPHDIESLRMYPTAGMWELFFKTSTSHGIFLSIFFVVPNIIDGLRTSSPK